MTKFKLFHFVFILLLYISQTAFVNAQIETLNFTNKTLDVQETKKISAKNRVLTEEKTEIDEDDLIHYGDLIDVDIEGSTEYDWRGTITPEGFLDGLDFTENNIYGLCRTEKNVADQIAESYSKFLNNPQIVVTILDRSNRPLSTLFGAVKLPQKFKLKRKINLNELIVLAGGFTEKASGEIQILRLPDASCVTKLKIQNKNSADKEEIIKASQDNGSNFINIKISDLLNGKKEANPEILYGDVIAVLIANPVYLIGGVVNPTKISMREALTLSRAILSVGGLTKQADSSKITIFRREGGKTNILRVNLDDIESKKTEDITLKAYDIVDVSENGRDEKKYPPVIRIEDIENKQNSELPIRIID